MKRICYMVLFLLILGQGQAVSAAGLLTGVTRLSCEALLCLSSPARPAACNPALSYYFGIKKFTWPATFAARLRFLNKCPTGRRDWPGRWRRGRRASGKMRRGSPRRGQT